MKKIYVVFGQTGEYSDGREWVVAAYRDETKAQTHVDLAEAWLRERGFSMNSDQVADYDARHDAVENRQNPYDPEFGCDYTGTRYYLVSVDLRLEVPQVEVRA